MDVTTIMATAFDHGEAEPQEESKTSQLLQERADALHSIQTWPLVRVESHWDLQSETGRACHIGDLPVSPQDMTYFKIEGTNLHGLAATRLQKADQIWHFKETNIAFVARMSSEDKVTIVGRIFLFPRVTSDAEPYAIQNLTSQEIASSKHLLKPQDILLSSAELFRLANCVEHVD